jgi:hypothetical protein
MRQTVRTLLLAAIAGCHGCPVRGSSGRVLLSRGNYAAVQPGVAKGTPLRTQRFIASRDVSFAGGLGVGMSDMDVLTLPVSGEGPATVVPITSAGDAVFGTLVVAPAPPERALFLAAPQRGDLVVTGARLMLVDLSGAPTASPIADTHGSARGIPAGGFLFGRTGAEIVFIEGFGEAAPGLGTLVWSDGSRAVEIGAGATLHGLVLSRRRSTVLAGARVNLTGAAPLAGTGDLVAIDMASGASRVVDTGVTILAWAYSRAARCAADAPPAGDCLLAQTQEAAFAMNDSGDTVAYEKAGEVRVAHLSPGPVSRLTLGHGRFPGLSPSGRRVAFHDDAGRLEVHDLDFSTNTSAPSSSLRASVSARGTLLPLFTADERYVAVLTDLLPSRGQNSYVLSSMGTIALVPIETTPVVAPLASAALWHSLTFWPAEAGHPTAWVGAVGNMADPFTGTLSAAGAGIILAGAPERLLHAAPLVARPPFRNVRPGQFGTLPSSGRLLLLTPSGVVLWSPADDGTATATTMLVPDVSADALQTSAMVPGLTGTDEAIFQVPAPDGPDLWGVFGDKARLLMKRVTCAALSTDGRVLAIHPTESAGESEIWLVGEP